MVGGGLNRLQQRMERDVLCFEKVVEQTGVQKKLGRRKLSVVRVGEWEQRH